MSTRDTSTPSDDAPDPRRCRHWRWWLAFFMTVLDGTIVTVALPRSRPRCTWPTARCNGC